MREVEALSAIRDRVDVCSNEFSLKCSFLVVFVWTENIGLCGNGVGNRYAACTCLYDFARENYRMRAVSLVRNQLTTNVFA